MYFQASRENRELSPYTGLDREGWIEAGKFLLEGIFSHIQDENAPIVMPRHEREMTYPNAGTPPHKVQAEYFEGLARSFFIAAPLISIEPELSLCGISLREYYRRQVLMACTPGNPCYVLDYAAMEAMGAQTNPFRTYQQTVEVCALVICLWISREQIWSSYTQPERDRLAGFIRGFAQGNTVPQNWRLFNMLALAFLAQEGYDIDEGIMRDHAQSILNYYVGDGWYRDGQSFDYYAVWAFNVYAPLWNLWYGYRREPALAVRFEAHANEMIQTLPSFFDRDAYTNMWGRSNIYRNAATSAFAANFFLAHPAADPGLSRRIASGSLLQFLSREDVFFEGIPCLGFYRPFLPLIQPYSCAASPFWLGKAFLCLCLPEEHPFWTAREHNGLWDELSAVTKDGEHSGLGDAQAAEAHSGSGGVRAAEAHSGSGDAQAAGKHNGGRGGKNHECCLDGPGLCLVNHASNGMTELRSGKVLKAEGDRHGIWNYGKLAYNTKFPWEAASQTAVESQQYVLEDMSFHTHTTANACFWAGQRGGVLYRRQFFGFSQSREYHWIQAINLADFPVADGLFRADKLRCFQRPLRLNLGAYGFPDNGTELERLEEGNFQALVLRGHDSQGRPRQLAMSIFAGFDELKFVRQTGCNPDSEHSILVYASAVSERQYAYEKYWYLSQVLCRDTEEPFTRAEIFPVAALTYADPEGEGGYGPLCIEFKDGSQKIIEFEGIEGRLSL